MSDPVLPRLPYRTYDTDKGGNAALMAPEVALARPGTFVNIRYDKSDLWTAGTIAYEMFGQINPFYRDKDRLLDSRTYTQVRDLYNSNLVNIARKYFDVMNKLKTHI